MVWRVVECRSAGCGTLLGSARVAALGLGVVRRVHWLRALSFQLLDEQLLGRGGSRNWRRTCYRRMGSHRPREAMALRLALWNWRGDCDSGATV